MASKILALALRRLAADFRDRYGYRPALVESFVKEDRFTGAAYRAANWQHVGRTQGRGKLGQWQDLRIPRKAIWVYPLHPRFREMDEVRATPALGGVWFDIRTKKQIKSVKGGNHWTVREGRRVRQEIRCSRVRLRPPYRLGQKLPVVDIWVVMATELNPPPGQDPIDWVILTSLPVEDLEAAVGVFQLYLVRWEIEVFHRVLKSGCKVEELQFKKSERIKPLLALYVIVAWRILYLTKLGRECPELPCDVVFAEEEWKSICRIYLGPADTGPNRRFGR